MGLFHAPKPPPISLPPPAAHPQILGSNQTVEAAQQAKRLAAAEAGAGLENTIATSPQGLAAPSTAKTTLLGG